MRVYFLLSVLFVFSFWLMFHTFRSDANTLYVSAKVYSDFGAILPLIRYFPHGLNFPIQHPLFPGEPIRYHFLFYAPIGLLESLGIPLQFALNVPSAIGFFSLLFLIFYLSRRIFSHFIAGTVSVILFLFNSSLSYLDFFSNHSLSSLPLLDRFVSFRPWNDSLVAAFWTLNIYTNQRHLGFSFAICLLIVLVVSKLQNRYLSLIGFLFGSLLFINQGGFLISFIFILFAFLFYPQIRGKLAVSFLGFLPWLFLYRQVFAAPNLPGIHIGFLADQPVNLSNFLSFWLYNYGFIVFFLLASVIIFFKKTANLFVPASALFIIGNLYRLSVDIINNHKLFNFAFIVFAVIVSGLFAKRPKLLIFLPFIVLGGIVDLFPVINDRLIPIPAGSDQKYFSTLPKNSVVLNSTWFYHPASLAGLPIYNGYSYFTWSYGYDQVGRERQARQIYESSNPCPLLAGTPVTHIEISPSHEQFIIIHPDYYKYQPDYLNPVTGLRVYAVFRLCPNT